MVSRKYVVGIDVGTTAVKGGIFTSSGICLRQKRIAYPTTRCSGTEVEQDPGDWLRATEQILEEVTSAVPVEEIAGIGICSQTNTHVFVDADGRPLAPAITWQDTRCEEQARRIDALITDPQRIEWWGAASHVAASHTVNRMAWMLEHRPEVWRRTACVLTPKDYCLLHLTGRRVGDALSSFDLVDLKGQYIPELVGFVPGACSRLPELHPFTATAGACTRGILGDAQVPITIGTMDGWASMIGAGVAAAGEGAYLSGTSEIVILASDRRVNVPGIVSFIPSNGWHVHAGPTQSGGDSLRWLAQILGRPIEEVLREAASVDRSRAKALFLPHLQGERAPLWDSDSRAAFLGLAGSMGAAELALSVLEGVALSAKLLLDEAVKAAALDYNWLYVAGGGSQSDLWCQIRADVLGVELRRPTFLDAGVMGAAIIAGVGAEMFPNLSAAVRKMTRVQSTFTPQEGYAERYAELLGIYRASYESLRGVNRRLG
jgi:xylulokinase